jgi:L-lactate dehydrogenase complex protein LldG
MRETSAAREAILRKLRGSAGRPSRPPRGETPKAGDRPLNTEALAKEFTDRAAFAGAVVKRIAGPGAAGAEAAAFMKEMGFSSALLSAERIVAESDIKAALSAAGLRVSVQGSDPASHRESSFGSDVGVTGALAGIAETGTVALCLGDGYSRLISLAPFAHVVLLPVRDIVADTHHFWSLMTDRGLYAEKREGDFGKKPATGSPVRSKPGARPPAFTFVTGPSMTADIALTSVRGIHGPGKLLILLLDH